MAFQQKEWKNRLSEHPTRRLLTPTDGSDAFEVDVTREEGTIMQQGDPFSAANMNDLEQRIADGIGGGDENMAPIEEGPESANAYTVGQLLIYGGQLYRVISAIAIGNTLVEDVNIESTTLSNEFVGEMTANGNRLYMDYKDGKYGYNTSPTRGADTFVPFKRSTHYRLGTTGQVPSGTNLTNTLTNLGIDPNSLTSANFIYQATSVNASVHQETGAAVYGWGSKPLSMSYNPTTHVLTYTTGASDGTIYYNVGAWTSGYIHVIIDE